MSFPCCYSSVVARRYRGRGVETQAYHFDTVPRLRELILPPLVLQGAVVKTTRGAKRCLYATGFLLQVALPQNRLLEYHLLYLTCKSISVIDIPACIRKVSASNLGLETNYCLTLFLVLLSHSRQILIVYLKIDYNHIFAYHLWIIIKPSLRHYITYECCTTPRVVRQQNAVMSPAGLRANNDCAGEDQRQFTHQIDWYNLCSWEVFTISEVLLGAVQRAKIFLQIIASTKYAFSFLLVSRT
jgi:hypothetical protein